MAKEQVGSEKLVENKFRKEITQLQLTLRGAVLNNIHFRIAFQTIIDRYIETGKTQIIGRDTPVDAINGNNIWRYEHSAQGESRINSFEKEVLSKGTVKDGQISWERSLTILYSPPIPVIQFAEGEEYSSPETVIQKGSDFINELKNVK